MASRTFETSLERLRYDEFDSVLAGTANRLARPQIGREAEVEIAIIGLGRMGAGLAARLLQGGHRVVAFDPDAEARRRAAELGAACEDSLHQAILKLSPPRTVWLMVPAGQAVEEAIDQLCRQLQPGDVVADGGNSNYRDSMRRAERLRGSGLHFVDVGTSGGIWGRENGFCLMVGGNGEAVERMRPVFETLAPSPQKGWGHVGPCGAGHFVKMIHNGIEYGMMQAMAEGFALLRRKQEFSLNMPEVADIWRHGSVIRSWLLDLAAQALRENVDLDGIAAFVEDSGEGRWTVAEAIEQDLSAPVITLSLLQRLRSREPEAFAEKLLAAMRNQFGGHAVRKEPPQD